MIEVNDRRRDELHRKHKALGSSMKSILSTTSDSSGGSSRSENFKRKPTESLKSYASNDGRCNDYDSSASSANDDGYDNANHPGAVLAQGVIPDGTTTMTEHRNSTPHEPTTFMGWDDYSTSNYSSTYSTSSNASDGGMLQDFPEKPSHSDCISVDEESQMSSKASNEIMINNEFDSKRPWRKPPLPPQSNAKNHETIHTKQKNVDTMNSNTCTSSIDGYKTTTSEKDLHNRATLKAQNSMRIHKHRLHNDEGSFSAKSDDDRQSARSITTCNSSVAGSEISVLKVAKSALDQSKAALAGVNRDPYQALYAHEDEDRLFCDLSVSPSYTSKPIRESYFALTGNVKPSFPQRQSSYASDHFSYADIAKGPKLSQTNSFTSSSNDTSSLSRFFKQHRAPSRQSSRQSSLMSSRHSLLSSRYSLLSRQSLSIVSSRQSSMLSSLYSGHSSLQSTNQFSNQQSSNSSSIGDSNRQVDSDMESIEEKGEEDSELTSKHNQDIAQTEQLRNERQGMIALTTDEQFPFQSVQDDRGNSSLPNMVPLSNESDDCSVSSASSMLSFNSSMGSVIDERLHPNTRNHNLGLQPVTEECDEGDGNDNERHEDRIHEESKKKSKITAQKPSNQQKDGSHRKKDKQVDFSALDKEVKCRPQRLHACTASSDSDHESCQKRIARLYQRMWDYKRGLGFALIATIMVVFASVLTLNFTSGSSNKDYSPSTHNTRTEPTIAPSKAVSKMDSDSGSGPAEIEVKGGDADYMMFPTPSPTERFTPWPTPKDTYLLRMRPVD